MKQLWIAPVGGLGDRIRLILFALELAAKDDRELHVSWIPNFHLGCEFEKLFKCESIKVHDHLNQQDIALCDFGNSTSDSIKRMIWNCHAEVIQMTAFVDGYSFSRFDREFQPTEEIESLVNDFCQRSGGEHPWIGVNVRCGDKHDETPPLEEYFEKVDYLISRHPESKVYLCTDGGAVVEGQFLEKYTERLLIYPMRSLDRNTPEHCIDAVVTLFLMKQCHTLVTSNYSGFSRMAAGMSRAEMPGKISTVKLSK